MLLQFFVLIPRDTPLLGNVSLSRQAFVSSALKQVYIYVLNMLPSTNFDIQTNIKILSVHKSADWSFNTPLLLLDMKHNVQVCYV